MLEGFKENKIELQKLMKKGLLVQDIHSFEKSAESIMGAEINRLIDFIINHYQISKDKFKIKFNELQRLMQSWLEYESRTQEDENRSETLKENTQNTEYSQPTDDGFKLNHQKQKMKKLIELKIAKHNEKIKEIFENYSEDTEAKEALAQLGLTEEQLKGNNYLFIDFIFILKTQKQRMRVSLRRVTLNNLIKMSHKVINQTINLRKVMTTNPMVQNLKMIKRNLKTLMP